MELIKNLELNDFLNPDSKNYIACYLNEVRLINMGPENPSYGFFHMLHQGQYLAFVEINEIESKSRILPLAGDCQITYLGQPFDLVAFHKIILEAKAKWVKEYAMPFPDILISGNPALHRHTASISIDETTFEHMIYFPLEYLANFDSFSYVLGHELGHLYFRRELKNHHQDFLKEQVYKNPAFVKVALFLIVFSGIFLVKNPNLLIFVAILSVVFNLTLLYFIASSLSYQERKEKYTEEFFSDYFSFHFMGPKDLKNISLFEGEYNLWTHPGGKLRKSYLSQFKTKPLKEWKSPVEEHPHYFFSASIYEMSFFFARLINFY